jgi:hypothetical protein
VTDRREVERRVDELAREHSGRSFAEAIQSYSATLDEHRREELKQVLLERAAGFDQAIMDRVDARGWLRRQWDRATTPPSDR